MYRRLLAVSLACSLLVAIGCGPSPEQRITGSWEGQFILSDEALAIQNGNPMAAAMKGVMASLRASHEFRADKTYKAELPTLLGTVKSSGSWEVVTHTGDTITVRLIPDQGTSFDRAVTFTDADHFETHDENGTFKFARKAAS